jgi:hypothetical protein
LNTLLFLFAKTRPGDGGGRAENAAPPSLRALPRTTRILDGKDDVVGVAGRTLTEELCGEALNFMLALAVGLAMDVVVEDVDEALECV